MSGIERLAKTILADMERRLSGQRKTQRSKLSLLVATMLEVRSANLMDLAACLPRPAERLDTRYQWIKRLLANARVVSDAVMADRKSTRLNSSHANISYAVFWLKKKGKSHVLTAVTPISP